MASSTPPVKVDRYIVIHVATTCDEHGVYVTKDSAEVIELGWILVDANTLDEVRGDFEAFFTLRIRSDKPFYSSTVKAFW